jgi:putative ABC transport system permease protein
MTIAVGMVAAIPTFVGAAQGRVLRQQLAVENLGRNAAGKTAANNPEPFAFKFTFLGLGRDVLSIDDLYDLDAYMQRQIVPRLLLPTRYVVRYVATDGWAVQPGASTWAKYPIPSDSNNPVAYLNLDVMSDIENHIMLEEGTLPSDFGQSRAVALASPVPDMPMIEGLVTREFANKFGVTPGDVFSLTITEKTNLGERDVQILARVTGVWVPQNSNEEFWIVSPRGLNNTLIVAETTLTQRIAPMRNQFISMVIWNYMLDDGRLTIENAPSLIAQADTLNAEVQQKRAALSLTQTALVRALRRFVNAAQDLLVLMIIFSLPMLGVVLSFIALIASMVVQQQEGELAILRSRGASAGDIVLLYVIQGGVLGATALALGMLLSVAVATLMLNTLSFLNFNPRDLNLITVMPFQAWQFGALTALIGIVATLVPAINATRRNILSYAAERGRTGQRPFWQRAFLDVLLLIFSGYGYYQLSSQGNLGTLGAIVQSQATAATNVTGDPLRDPVRFLLPMLALTAMGLLVVRITPLVFRLLAWLIEPLRPLTPIFLALRDLARSPRLYTAPLSLLIFTLGIAAYGASIARTLDQHLTDTTYLSVGADVRLIETGESNKPPAFGSGPNFQVSDSNEPELFTFIPVKEHLNIDGVKAVARAANLPARPAGPRRRDERSRVLLIDRLPFQQVSAQAFRDDYTYREFNAMVNELSRSPDSILIERRVLFERNLKPGNKFIIEIQAFGDWIPITYTIRDVFDAFPIVAGGDAPFANGNFFVTNMDYTFEKMRRETAYDVLLKTDGKLNGDEVAKAARDLNYIVLNVFDARQRIFEAQQQPERQGLFGTITAGFLFMAMLTLIGFVVYALLSFRRRAIELGTLRALGLSGWQMSLYLIFTHSALVAMGALAGSAIGIGISYLFIPLLQVANSGVIAAIPAFIPRIDWANIAWLYAALGTALLLVLASSLVLLRRLKMFEVVKMGAT